MKNSRGRDGLIAQMGTMSLLEMRHVQVLVVAVASVRARSAFALRSAIALAELAAPRVDALLAPGFARSSAGLESGWAVASVAAAAVSLCQTHRNLRKICSRGKGGKRGTFCAVL